MNESHSEGNGIDETIDKIMSDERDKFEILCRLTEEVKQTQLITTDIIKQSTEESIEMLTKNKEKINEEINDMRNSISNSITIAENIDQEHGDIENTLLVNQIRQFSYRNYLPKILSNAEVMAANTFYNVGNNWKAGIIKYSSQAVLCLFNEEDLMAIHILPTYFYFYQNTSEYKYDFTKDNMTKSDKDPHLNWMNVKDYTNVDVEESTILTPSNKAKICFLVKKDYILVRYDTGDIVAIDTMSECVFVDGKLISFC